MVLTKDAFTKEMVKAGLDNSSHALKEAGSECGIAVTALTAIFVRKMTEQLFDQGLVGQLDMPLHRFTVTYMNANATLVTQDPLFMDIADIVTSLATMMLADILPELYLRRTTNK